MLKIHLLHLLKIHFMLGPHSWNKLCLILMIVFHTSFQLTSYKFLNIHLFLFPPKIYKHVNIVSFMIGSEIVIMSSLTSSTIKEKLSFNMKTCKVIVCAYIIPILKLKHPNEYMLMETANAVRMIKLTQFLICLVCLFVSVISKYITIVVIVNSSHTGLKFLS